MQTLKLIIM